MAPKPPPHWDSYRDQMSQFDYGHALWETIPVADPERIQPGDVGYVREGSFRLLFSASLSPDNGVPGSDFPSDFEQLTIGKTIRRSPLPPRPFNTKTVRVVGERPIHPSSSLSSPMAGSASCHSFRLEGREGALLLTKYPTYREDVEQVGNFKKYMKSHYKSWVKFAEEKGLGDLDPVLVTGVDRTRDFMMLYYSKDNDGVMNCDFTTPIPGVNPLGKWNFKDDFVHTNHRPLTLSGPLPTQATDPTSSGDNDPETTSDQHVFIRYFTMRKRFYLFPDVMKAAAGPHELGGGGYDNGGSPLEVLCGSDQGPDLLYTPSNLSDGDGSSPASIDTGSDCVVHNIRAGGRDDFDVIADYVFQNSNAESMLLHHEDIALVRKLGDGTDLCTLVFEKRPCIVVDRDGVGTIEPQTDDPAGTWDGGGMTPTISSVPSDNRPQVANHMVPLEPLSRYQHPILDSAQESATLDASGPVSKSIAPVFGDPMLDWSHTGPQLSGEKGKTPTPYSEFTSRPGPATSTPPDIFLPPTSLPMTGPHSAPVRSSVRKDSVEEELRFLRNRVRELEGERDAANRRLHELHASVAPGYPQIGIHPIGPPSPVPNPPNTDAFRASWIARTEARKRKYCSLNRAGNALCAWHDSRRERRAYPPRMAPPGHLNCGCTFEEALFEESLARHNIGSRHPGESVRMDPALRNPLLKLLEQRYRYRDGDFERDPITGTWVEGEGHAPWETRASSGSSKKREDDRRS